MRLQRNLAWGKTTHRSAGKGICFDLYRPSRQRPRPQIAKVDDEDDGRNLLVVFAHANGFHKGVWDPIISRVMEQPALRGNSFLAMDLSGHGDSPSPFSDSSPPDSFSWASFGDDVLDAMEGEVGKFSKIIGVGHSMGAASLIHAENRRPGTFTRLVLFEPVIKSPPYETTPERLMLNRLTLKRKREFESTKAAYDRFKGKGAFSRWDNVVLRSYLDEGLRSLDDGRVVLKCDPKFEALLYLNHEAMDQLVRKIACPTRICAGGDSDFKASEVGFERSTEKYYEHVVKNLLPNKASTFSIIPGATHFVTMEKVNRVAEIISEECKTAMYN